MVERARVGDMVKSLVNYFGIKIGDILECESQMSEGEGIHTSIDGVGKGCLYHCEYEVVGRVVDNTTEKSVEVEQEELVEHPTGAKRESKEGKGKQHYLAVGFPYTLNEVSKHMENPLGRNWEEGLPVSSYADAALRHLVGFLSGDPEPHHLRAAIWNMLCMSETIHRVEVGTLPSEVDDVDRSRKSHMNGGES